MSTVSNISEESVILSIAWEKGSMCASHFDVNSLQVFVSDEIIDLGPEYTWPYHILKQFSSVLLIISGPIYFFKYILRIVNQIPNLQLIPHENIFTKSNNLVLHHTHTSKRLLKNKQRIHDIYIPAMKAMNRLARQIFVDTVLPLNSNTVVHSLGNLIAYLNDYWNLINPIDTLMITDLNVYNLNTMLRIDGATLSSLQIFHIEHHPSAFKKGSKYDNRDGCSLFSMMNRCSSKVGEQHLKEIFMQPTNSSSELQERFVTINWCLDKRNSFYLEELQMHLRRINNVTTIYRRLQNTPSDPSCWLKISNTVYNIYKVCIVCFKIKQFNDGIIPNQFQQLIQMGLESRVLQNFLDLFYSIFDVAKSQKQNRCVVKHGFNKTLDAMKEYGNQLKLIAMNTIQMELGTGLIANLLKSMDVLYLNEIGFVFGLKITANYMDSLHILENTNINMIFKDYNYIYYQTEECKLKNEELKTVYSKAYLLEREIFHEFSKNIRQNILEVMSLVKLCAKLDCMNSMAVVARELNLVQPNIVSGTGKIFQIVDGRNLFVKENCITSDTYVDESKQKLINIIVGQNCSGKSVHIKQIALIAYLCHIGSFVPAKSVNISLFDSIMTKILTPESGHSGLSTFLNDLQHMAYIIRNSSSKSLVLIDDFGKGTEELQGKFILAACIANLQERIEACPMTFIATHFSDLLHHLPSDSLLNVFTLKKDCLVPTYKLETFERTPISAAAALHFLPFKDFIQYFTNENNTNKTADVIRNKILCAYNVIKEVLNDNFNFERLQEYIVLHKLEKDCH